MNDREKEDDYEIGYGKPPKSTQFQKGTSGNPKGRPKSPMDFDRKLLRALEVPVVITENGRSKRMTRFDVAITQLVHKSMKGDLAAIKLMTTYHRQASENVALANMQAAAERERLSDVENLTMVELAAVILSDPETRKSITERRQSDQLSAAPAQDDFSTDPTDIR